MFYSKPTLIIYILRNELVFYTSQGKTARLGLPIEVVDMLEIVNRQKYKNLLENFLRSNHLRKQRVLLVLSDQLIFTKTFEHKKGVDYELQADDFSAIIPLDITKQHIIVDQKKDTVILYATNSELFQVPVDILLNTDSKVIACVPAAEYGEQTNQGLNQATQTTLFNKFRASSSVNFLANK